MPDTVEKGHLNIYTRDQDSVITGFGRHARVVVFDPDRGGLVCRVDREPLNPEGEPIYPRLPDPTPAQILTVCRKGIAAIRGRWVLRSWTDYENGRCAEVVFDRATKKAEK